jgi:organic radical activating enzyme
MKVSVSEVFYSLQGEGSTIGYPAVFVRLGGCNLLCGGHGTIASKKLHDGATWRCDTIEVWMKSTSKLVDDILLPNHHDAIKNGANVIITGGEPLLQMKGVEAFVYYLRRMYKDVFIEIETNGTIVPTKYLIKEVNQFNCSPKLSNSGMSRDQYFNKDAIVHIDKAKSIFKFVISSEKDYQEAFHNYFHLIDSRKIYLMPAGENQFQLAHTKNLVAEICKKDKLKFTNRLHIELWNQKTGV